MSSHPGRPRAGTLAIARINHVTPPSVYWQDAMLTLAGRSGHGVLNKLHGPVGHGRTDRGTPDKSHPTANGPLLPQERTLGLGMSALAAEGMQFSWCWNGGTISLNLGVIWEMSV